MPSPRALRKFADVLRCVLFFQVTFFIWFSLGMVGDWRGSVIVIMYLLTMVSVILILKAVEESRNA